MTLRVDSQKEICPYSDPQKESETQASPKLKKLLNPWAPYPQLWNKIFLGSCVFGVLVDPLFLYVLVINEDRKCLAVDEKMKYIAIVLRTFADLFYVLHIIIRLQKALALTKEFKLSVFHGLPWSYLLIDVLAILPLPQVVVSKCFSKLAGSRSLTARKILMLSLLLQYVPRILRIYLSAKDLGRSFDLLTRLVWIRGAFLFSLYIVFGHIFGAVWYLYAIFRETACWHRACRSLSGCQPSPFDCRLPNPITNMTYLNGFCPVDPPNTAVYDFGIFTDAIESGILTKKDFFQKFSHSFWWGLRNLSSFGQNLDTSANVQENLFAALISILGLLLFLYLIGNLQTYMQLATTKSEVARRKLCIKQPEIDALLSSPSLSDHKKKVIVGYLQCTIKEDKDFDLKCLFSLLEEDSVQDKDFAYWVANLLDMKKHEKHTSCLDVELWISRNGLDQAMKEKIMQYLRLRFREVKDVDIKNILPILPSELALSAKKELCFPILKKVPMLQNIDDHFHVYETICIFLKPVIYAEKSYIIRKEEPLDLMLFVTQGSVWSFGSSTSPTERLHKGDFFGEEVLKWRVNSASYADLPISSASLQCHTKVEAFALMAGDLEQVLSHCWAKFLKPNDPIPDGLKPFAVVSVQRHVRAKKKAKDNPISIVCA